MLYEIKPNVSGIVFSKTGVLVSFKNMSVEKKNANDPDYYKVIIDLDGELLDTSAWIGCEIEKLQKDVKDVNYKPYKFTFSAVKNVSQNRNGNVFEYYKIKVVGIQKASVSDALTEKF